MKMEKKILKAANFIKKKFNTKQFDVAVVFGSGLTPNIDFNKDEVILYKKIPFFPVSKVKGHCNKLAFKIIRNKKVLFFMGRVHLYEGFSSEEVTFSTKVLKELNVKYLIVTNAAGALSEKFNEGEIVIIKDQINFMHANPLISKERKVEFLDMSNCYSRELIEIVKQYNKDIKEAVYIGVTGPNYETTAEVNFFKKIGADIVGMSTVLETIVARANNINVLGLSCITNVYKTKTKTNHEKIIEIASVAKDELKNIIYFILERLI